MQPALSFIVDIIIVCVRAAGAPVLVSSPFQHELGHLRMERLRLEESHLLEVRRQEQLESMRYPLPKWSVVIIQPPNTRIQYLSDFGAGLRL
jgi:hypothetical protein